MDKQTLRSHFARRRQNLSPEEVITASAAVCRRLAAWSPIASRQSSISILTYLAFCNEIDLAPLFDTLPQARWVVPRIIDDNGMMLHIYDPARLVRHRFGMLEPAPDLPVVDPATLDLVLTPGVAFDRNGWRLGFGGGYYDRLLPATTAMRVGVTYDESVVDTLPHNEHDQRMDWVVTPSEMIHIITAPASPPVYPPPAPTA